MRGAATLLAVLCLVVSGAHANTPTPTPVEIESERNAYAKVLQYPDGRRVARISAVPQHYHDGVRWQDVSTDFEAEGAERIARRLPFAARVAKFGTANWWLAIGSRDEGWAHGFRLPGTPTVSGNAITYSPAWGSCEYTVRRTGVKLDCTISARRGPQTYQWQHAKRGTATDCVANADGSLSCDALRMQRAFAVGANGVEYQAGPWQIVGGQVGFAFDDSALPDEALPYVLDPSANYQSDTGDVQVYGNNATYTTARSTASGIGNSSNTVNTMGQYTGFYVQRFFVKFDTSPLPDDVTVTGATLSLAIGADFSTTDFDIKIHEYDWSASDPIAAGNQEAAFDGCLAATTGAVTWRNTSGIATNTRYDSPALSTARVSLTGFTYYCVISARDVSGTEPTGNEFVHLATGNNATYYPRIDVEYSLPTATPTSTETNTKTATPTVTPTRTPTPVPTNSCCDCGADANCVDPETYGVGWECPAGCTVCSGGCACVPSPL